MTNTEIKIEKMDKNEREEAEATTQPSGGGDSAA
jgi:hypothetical protein